MKIRELLIFSAFLLSVVVVPRSNAAESVEFVLSIIEKSVSEDHQLTRFRKRPMNLRCEIIEFVPDMLVGLIQDISQGTLFVSDTRVSFQLFDGTHSFSGKSIEAPSLENDRSPYVWEGQSSHGDGFGIIAVISPDGSANIYITSPSGVSVISPTSAANQYILCQRDPSYPGRKID